MYRIESLFQIAGLLLCGVSFAYLACGCALQLQRWFIERRRFEAERDLLRSNLAQLATDLPAGRKAGWDGWRKFQVQKKVRESADCHSIYLVPHDKQAIPAFLPGQYLTFQIRWPLDGKPLIRCYSLSDGSASERYRITVKKAPGGDATTHVSHYLNDVLQEGDLLDVGAPRGSFCLDPRKAGPTVFLAGGIGITPLISMIRSLAKAATGHPLYLFYGVRDGSEHTFKDELKKIASEYSQLKIITCYSRPAPHDAPQRDFDHPGRVTIDLIRRTLPSSNFQYYLCGPTSFTQDLSACLQQWQVPADAIHSEAFGPSSIKASSSGSSEAPAATSPVRVEFKRSRKQVECDPTRQTILDAAENAGISINSGCQAGHCGACATAIKRGEVSYVSEPHCPIAPGTCLVCIAVPSKGPLVLDA